MSDRWLSIILVAPALSLMLLYLAYPLWTLVSSAFLQWYTLSSPPHWVGLDNLRSVLTGPDFFPALGRSIYYTIGNVIAQTVLGLGIALILYAKLPYRNIARGIILFPFVVPTVVAALIWHYLLNDLTGLVNYVLISTHVIQQPLGLLSDPNLAMNTIVAVSTWKLVPITIILFLARLQSVSVELIEAARVDGANALMVFRYVILPWMMPVIVVAVMLRTIWSFNEFDLPFLLTQGGPAGSTLVLPVLIRQLAIDQLDVGSASAVSLIMVAILAVCGTAYIIVYRRQESMTD